PASWVGRAMASAEPRDIPLQTTVASPWPFFMQLSGQGPALSGDRVVWTATSGQRQAGAEANRIYTYDLDDRRLNVAVRSHFGALGFIGSYALVGAKLAYVDTGFLGPTAGPSSAPSDPGRPTSTAASSAGTFVWQVSIVDLRTGRTQTIATSPRAAGSSIAPQISFDGTNLLMLETIDVSRTRHDSLAILYTLARHRRHLLQRARNVLFAAPAL